MPRAKKNMTSLLDSFESDTEKEHDAAVTAAVKTPKKSVGGDTRATALVSMTVERTSYNKGKGTRLEPVCIFQISC